MMPFVFKRADDVVGARDASVNVCFTTTNNVVSRLIRFFTRSKVSHSVITYRDSVLGRVMVMEANWNGFRNVPWSLWKKKNVIVARYSLMGKPARSVTRSLGEQADYLGTGYDYTALISLVLRRFVKRFRNPFGSSSKFFCSESVATFLSSVGVAGVDDPSGWTPDDVWRLVAADEENFHREE